MAKIVQINTVCNTGSTGKIAEGISKSIVENGWKSYIGYGRKGRKSQYSEEILIGSKVDFYLHAIGTRLLDSHGFFSKSATLNFLKQLDSIKPDLIHLHNIHGYYLQIEFLFEYIKKKSIPIIWTLHDCWPYTGHCAYYSASNCKKWKTHCEQCPQIDKYPKSYIDSSKRNFLRKKNIFSGVKQLTIVTPSEWLANEVGESFLKEYPIKIINNGVDLSVFTIKSVDALKLKLNIQNQKVILGVASIWEERKGFKDFIKLSSIIDNNYVIILVGLTASQINILPKNIIGIERTESIDELAQYYSLADVFFNPTFEDNFPTTNIEALACGTPVLTYKTGGSPEIIDQKTGWVVEQGDLATVHSILEAINIGNKPISECRTRAIQLYDQKLKFAEYIDVYKKYL